MRISPHDLTLYGESLVLHWTIIFRGKVLNATNGQIEAVGKDSDL